MRTLITFLALLALAACSASLSAEDPVFSGPQPGEPLPPLPVRTVTIAEDDVSVAEAPSDWIAQAEGKPLLLIFVHKLTRPSFAVTRTLTEYAGKLDGAVSGIVFLDEDPTEREQWLKAAGRRYLTRGVKVGLSADGADGPGAYGLNRNVTLTLLVGKQGKTTANFALVQPSVQADALKVAAALAEAAGAPRPTAEQLGAGEAMRVDIRPLLAPVINKQATPEEVEAAAKRVEQRAARQPAMKAAIGAAARRVVDSGRLETYGTPAAQKYLKKWAEWAVAPAARPKRDRPKNDRPKRPQRSASPDDS